MLRRTVAALVAFLFIASALLAADKTISVTLVKVDVKKKLLVVKDGDEKKEYKIDAKTKFLGPKGGLSDAGIKDDRLKPGAALELVIAGNNKTVREVHLPERKDLQ
jgi:hypothetical protein